MKNDSVQRQKRTLNGDRRRNEKDVVISTKVKRLLRKYADTYETPAFLTGDPSWFMHQVDGEENREATAFVAASLSFGSRSQFFPKIRWLLERSGGRMDTWIRTGGFLRDLPCNCDSCFYRLFTVAAVNHFLHSYQRMMAEFGSLGEALRCEGVGDGLGAVRAICHLFSVCGTGGIVPKDAQSACKRICLFLRWMARDRSPVDLGLWADWIDRRSLIMPLDTHVIRQARQLGLLTGEGTTMSAATRLTRIMKQVFPDDPLRGDFALFGYGVNHC